MAAAEAIDEQGLEIAERHPAIDGAPRGTRGGISMIHNFPATGEYTFKLKCYYDYVEGLFGQNLPTNLQGQEIEVSVDGARAAIFTIDPSIPETKGTLVTDPSSKASPSLMPAMSTA